MRVSPNGRRLVFIAGKGSRPAAPMVTVRLEDGVDVALEPGHSARFTSNGGVVWGPHEDGQLRFALDLNGWGIAGNFMPLSGNTIATSTNALVAVHRTDPRRVLANWRSSPIAGATDPAISDDGNWLAYLRPDDPRPGVSSLWVERASNGAERRSLAVGALSSPRFGGTTLVWETGGGTIAGCADVSNPHVAPVSFVLPTWKFYKPVPVWVPSPGGLFVLVNADRGEDSLILLIEWASLERQAPEGWFLGVSSGSGYEHDARPVNGGPVVRSAWLSPQGLVDEAYTDVRVGRGVLVAPKKPEPPVVPPDIPWTPDPTRTVDMLDFHKAASTAYLDHGDGTGELWMHKSQERPNWGEHRDHDDQWIGFVEDRSTGTRMITLPEPRPKKHSFTNTTRDRWPPEQIVAWNAAHPDRPVGDYTTLPLAGYAWIGNRPFMPRHVTGRADLTFWAQYDWWDDPAITPVVPGSNPPRGRWELHPPIRLHIAVVTGYARFNGHDVYALSRYGVPDSDLGPGHEIEWSAWGPDGWLGFIVFDHEGRENVASRRIAPPEQRASRLDGPFVPARFPVTYPIFDAAREPQEKPPVSVTPAQLLAFIAELDDPILLGARQRYRDEVLLPRDRPLMNAIHSQASTDPTKPDLWLGDVMTGGASLFFDRGYTIGYLLARIAGQDVMGASVVGLERAANDYRRAVGIVVEPPPLPPREFSGPLSVAGKDFVTP